ncbi:MAG: hypothetical protein ABIM30_01285 [candidate division WOR-3 bacterium]
MLGLYKELTKNLQHKEIIENHLVDRRIFQIAKERLPKNPPMFEFYNPFFIDVYSTSLFIVVLNSEANSIDLPTITKSIHSNDIRVFYFLLREYNPSSIKSSKLTELMLELNKEKT